MRKNKVPSSVGNSTLRQTRRRTVNHPSGTFAHFLDALISYDFAYFRTPDIPGFTIYKENLAKALSIHPRHLSRLLSGQTLPELRLLTRISKQFPHVRSAGWIPKLTWECVEKETELLPNGSVISIFIGHLSGGEVDAISDAVIRNIATSIVRRRFRYVYVLAPLSRRLQTDELPAIQMIDRLRVRLLSAWLSANPGVKRDSHIDNLIRQKLSVFQTRASQEAGHFWSFLPRYLAASNLLAPQSSCFMLNQFSVAFDSGSVPYPSARANPKDRVPQPITTGGWSYMEENYDREFRAMFMTMERLGSFVNPERKNQMFPAPSLYQIK